MILTQHSSVHLHEVWFMTIGLVNEYYVEYHIIPTLVICFCNLLCPQKMVWSYGLTTCTAHSLYWKQSGFMKRETFNMYFQILLYCSFLIKICTIKFWRAKTSSYNLSLLTETSLFFFFFDWSFAVLIWVLTWSCSWEKKAWEDRRALSFPSS